VSKTSKGRSDAPRGARRTKKNSELVIIKRALATTVKTSRQEKGWSQIDLANRLGSSQSRIAKVEAGDPSVSLDLMVRALLEVGASPHALSHFLGARAD
jgi:ribosome-binding protein aMBF1 (putative translation factor)